MNRLTLKALLELPTIKDIQDNALPNERHPSDHLPMAAIFEIKLNNEINDSDYKFNSNNIDELLKPSL